MRTPTERQYDFLRILGSGSAAITITRGKAKPFLKHGWVTAEETKDSRYVNWVRITPDGLRALALAVERYGLPDLGPKEDRPKPDPPLVQRLRIARDEARTERDETERRAIRAERVIYRIQNEVEGLVIP